MSYDSLSLAKELIRKPSITPEDAGCMQLLDDWLTPMGFSCHHYVFEEEGTESVQNLYARLGDKAPVLCFAGHVDVVPTGDRDAWTHDPFDPVIKNGMLYGRGACDMKVAIACFLAAVSEFLESKENFDGSIAFLITGDEEGPSINGTRKLLQKIDAQGEIIDGCIVGEPTSDHVFGDIIKIGRRGSVNFQLAVSGKQGHVAYPQLAANPIPLMVNILQALNQHTLDAGSDYFEPSNLEVVNIEVGNEASNVIPAKVSVSFNIRFNDHHTSLQLIEWVTSVCEAEIQCDDYSYVLDHRVSGESFFCPPERLALIVKEAVKDTCGIEARLDTGGGTSDARFIKDYTSEIAELGLRNATAHKVDECVAVEDIEKLKSVYQAVLERYYGSAV